MGAISFSSLLFLPFLLLAAQARTFPGEGKAVFIIYGRSSSTLQLHLSSILSALSINSEEEYYDTLKKDDTTSSDMVEAPVKPKPKPRPIPSPKPASPISELTTTYTVAGDVQGRKILTPPPPPKPASPTHYVAPHERSPPAVGGYYSSS
ncbi:hypothetical protein LINPERPRIM_LOCUS2196 [Linum perenne]